MKYCKECGKFFIDGNMLDDGVQDSRFPDEGGNRLFIEVCPACGGEFFDDLFDDDYVVADRCANVAHVCRDEQDIVEGIRLLRDECVDWDDIKVYSANDIADGDQFGRII